MRNTLYYGDNLPILREYIADASVDLVYLDPPFNSNRNYNVLFKSDSGADSEAQVQAFVDTWQWNQAAATQYQELITGPNPAVAQMMAAFYSFIGPSPMLAYLVMMAARLVELHRVLKPTGSLYLHCDPTASHYLKVVMDTVFGPRTFQNEIIWRRTTTKNDYRQGAKNWPRVHDVILYYSKNIDGPPVFAQPFADYSEEYVQSKYSLFDESGRRYMLDNLTAPGAGSRGHPQYELMGVTRYWRYNKEKMEQLVRDGKVVQPRPGAVPRYKRYLDEMPGIAIGDVWADIFPVNSQAAERLGYPTQKPVALLERIIAASSNPGDVVLDPFCGCGTTIAAAQKLDRRWIGIDITHLSIALQKYRLADAFKLQPGVDYAVVGEPADLGAARQLAQDNRYQFQWWALSLMGARPLGGEAGSKRGKMGADQGIDGVIHFVDDASGKPKRVLVQVKSGKVSSRDIRDLVGTVQREQAAMGVFVTLEPPSSPMLTESLSAQFYRSPGWNRDYPALQILTIEELLAGKRVAMPPTSVTFNQAEREQSVSKDQLSLGLE